MAIANWRSHFEQSTLPIPDNSGNGVFSIRLCIIIIANTLADQLDTAPLDDQGAFQMDITSR